MIILPQTASPHSIKLGNDCGTQKSTVTCPRKHPQHPF